MWSDNHRYTCEFLEIEDSVTLTLSDCFNEDVTTLKRSDGLERPYLALEGFTDNKTAEFAQFIVSINA